jgi:hypothetical protein
MGAFGIVIAVSKEFQLPGNGAGSEEGKGSENIKSHGVRYVVVGYSTR